MPELPDITLYVDAMASRLVGCRLGRIVLRSPFVLRSVTPPLHVLHSKLVLGVHRLGKRVVLGFEEELFLVLHLMIAGRLRWRNPGQKPGISPKLLLAAIEFEHGALLFTEAGSKKRASMQVVQGADALNALDPGGVEPLDVSLDAFAEALCRENHTLKRALTDPHLFSGIGNAYSDEILHAAKLSPLKPARSLSAEQVQALHEATKETLHAWIERLRSRAGGEFPEKVTAFPPGMAVHGRFKQPCPVCGALVQRIVYTDNECNYCPDCQTGGRRLADRALSRLLK